MTPNKDYFKSLKNSIYKLLNKVCMLYLEYNKNFVFETEEEEIKNKEMLKNVKKIVDLINSC